MEYQADLIVYGGTSAGVIAAVQAARMGKAVILVSPDEHLGGMSSSGLGWTDTGNKEVIGGLAREFYRRVYLHYQEDASWIWQNKEEYGNQGQDTPAMDPENKTMWIFEPHVAEAIFDELVADHSLEVHSGEWLERENGVVKVGGAIFSIRTLSGKVFKGEMFIDASYEGDLMAAAGVDYAVGREDCRLYNEQWNGIQLSPSHHYFQSPISPYRIPGDPNSGLLPRISAYAPRIGCHGDKSIQAYCFRLCLTQKPENRIPFEAPPGYDPEQYQLLIRVFYSGWTGVFQKFDLLPNLKTDANNYGPFSFDNIGMNHDYPEASYERRNEIIQEHKVYQQGLLYFIATDPQVPAGIQNEMNSWGYAEDEFADNEHWPYQLYVREARRMVGQFVMTENEIFGMNVVQESIGMGSYPLDSHNTQRYVGCDGFVQNEGDLSIVPPKPYSVALGSILPKAEECSNLLVPVALSASHTAFGSLRMEPVFMVLAQSAATLACMAIENGQTLHQVEYEKLRERLLADGQVLKWV